MIVRHHNIEVLQRDLKESNVVALTCSNAEGMMWEKARRCFSKIDYWAIKAGIAGGVEMGVDSILKCNYTSTH